MDLDLTKDFKKAKVTKVLTGFLTFSSITHGEGSKEIA